MTDIIQIFDIAIALIGASGFVYGAFSAKKLKDVLEVLQAGAKTHVSYMRIKRMQEAGKEVSIVARAGLGDSLIETYEQLEDITGKQIFNDASVAWILPEDPADDLPVTQPEQPQEAQP